jgi:dihydroxy-acid dehydratase
MGAISMGLPAIFCPAGPMLTGRWRGKTLGAGTHTRKYWDELRAGTLSEADWVDLEGAMTRSPGTCNTMGTASTMTSIAEALGLTLPGATAVPAADSGHHRMAAACGERIVEMVWQDLTPDRIVSRAALGNAIETFVALGGSTNAAVHLAALAGRLGLPFALADLDAAARRTPVLANLYPAGDRLMEDFHFAGGLPGLMSRLAGRLALDCPTVNGRSIGENLAAARVWDDDTIRPLDRPVTSEPAFALLNGNLAPDGAVIKPSAATPALLRHVGPAVVFENHADLSRRIDDPQLAVDAKSVLVLKSAGPIGGPGMPEWGALPIPKKLLARGVRDMVRLSDARMSGTHFGTCILHVAPESHVGGPLALVRDGDPIELDVPARRLELRVGADELARRRSAWVAPPRRFGRGYGVLLERHMTQANRGCDFDFLAAGPPTPEPEIY